jgi:hypothetical protein
MRHGRWIAPLLGAALVAALALPAGAAKASDQSILAAGVITKPDVPKSWKSSKQPDVNSTLKVVAACAPVLAATTVARKSPHQNSPTFTDPKSTAQLTNAQDQVYAFKTAAAASTYLGAFQAPTGSDCFQGLIQRAGTSTGAQPQVNVGPLTNLQSLGNQAVGYEGTLKLTAQNQTLTVVIDEIVVRVGRSLVVFQFGSPDQQIAQGPTIVRSVLTRLQHVGA